MTPTSGSGRLSGFELGVGVSSRDVVAEAYRMLDAGDVDGLMAALGDAVVAIPGATAISGDHRWT